MAEVDTLFGIHSVQAALETQAEYAIELIIADGERNNKIQRIYQLAEQVGIRIQSIKKSQMDKQTHDGNHQGVLLKMKYPKQHQEAELERLIDKPLALILALDSVQDPHNLGACLRTAEALGVDAVIAPKDRACDLTPVVRKVASGAAERVPFIRVTNLVRTLKKLQKSGLWVTGAAGEVDTALQSVDFQRATVLVMGSEGKGLRDITRKACDYLVTIPMVGAVGSFNVSVACGICLYEITRQRQT